MTDAFQNRLAGFLDIDDGKLTQGNVIISPSIVPLKYILPEHRMSDFRHWIFECIISNVQYPANFTLLTQDYLNYLDGEDIYTVAMHRLASLGCPHGGKRRVYVHNEVTAWICGATETPKSCFSAPISSDKACWNSLCLKCWGKLTMLIAPYTADWGK